MGLKEDYLNSRFGNDAHEEWLDDIAVRNGHVKGGLPDNSNDFECDSTHIPVTDDFIIETNIKLGKSPELESAFNRAVLGLTVKQGEHIGLVKSLVGRDDLKVKYGSNRNSYSPMQDKIRLSENSTVASFLKVSPDNLPPNLPIEFTDELMRHLVSLHETEHVTQKKLTKEEILIGVSQSVSYVTSVEVSDSILSSKGAGDLDLAVIQEADSDNAILNHLDDMGYSHLSQFWIDFRMKNSFDDELIEIPHDIELYEHDTATLLSHYRNTGEIIDVDMFIEEKKGLMAQVSQRVGIDFDGLIEIMEDYVISSDFSKDDIEAYGSDLQVKPQEMMHIVHSLLDDGGLEGVQKLEAENYLGAMGRLGYKPEHDPNFNYADKVRVILEDKIGLQRKDPLPDQEVIVDNNLDHTQVNSITP